MQNEKEFGAQVAAGERFEFGKNWSSFLQSLDDERIEQSMKAVRMTLRTSDLSGRRALDIGSGSGLSSLVFRKLGAAVTSFDFDPDSVGCTQELKRREGSSEQEWKVLRGSILDKPFLQRLGTFDLVYSWGVLHHTGEMWTAIENAIDLVAPNGTFVIAIYNDQGSTSRMWLKVKKAYNAIPRGFKWTVVVPAFLRLWGPTTIRDLLRGKPGATWRQVKATRGMDPWRDVIDWVGGLPFEVATPEAIFEFFRARGFALDAMKTCAGGLGCNEFVFIRARVSG